MHGGALMIKVFTSMIPPLVLIFLVLGTIFIGVATPTEGGAMGASGAIIMAPLLAPVAQKLGIDLVWFGVLLAVNMQTSFLHPPFGFALFYLRSVASKEIKTSDIYWGAIPFVCMQ